VRAPDQRDPNAVNSAEDFTYDPFSFELHQDPYPRYRLLRDEFPVFHNAERGFWALSRFHDVQAAARDWQTFSSAAGVDLDGFAGSFGAGNFLELDPPRHDQLRALVQKDFTPKAIARLEPAVRAIAAQLLDRLAEQPQVDLAQQFAWPLPIRVTSLVLGVPPSDLNKVELLAHQLLIRTPDSMTLPEPALQASAAMREYLAARLAERRRDPRDDILSRVALAQVDHTDIGDEAIGLCLILFSAGIDTTACLITNALLHLATLDDTRARLASDPTLIPPAIEEFLRYEAPVQSIARITTRPVTLHGTHIPEGERVSLVYGAANRDEREFNDPDTFKLDRPIRRHLAFGDGIHYCIGGPLARLEAKIALELFLTAVPEYEIANGAERVHHHTQRGLTKLPATLSAAPVRATP
jgi:cytochrome P450